MSDSKGGFSPTELKEMKDALSTIVESKIKPIQDWQTEKDTADLKNQKAIDELLTRTKDANPGAANKKSFGEEFGKQIKEQFEAKRSDFEQLQKDRHAKVSIELKTVGNMTTGNISGDGVQTYNSRQGLVPSQRINLRELIPTVPTETGTYVSYRETGSEGGFGLQTEGSAKSQIDYDLTEVKNVSGYIAGFARFSKQMMKQLPWLTGTLPRLLLRDFYKKENRHFYDLLATNSTGFTTTSETDDAKALIDVLMGRLDADYNNSYILCSHTAIGRILKLLYTNGYYQGSGGVFGSVDGRIVIAGTPVVGVTWVPSYDKVVIIDNDYVERVETESLRVEFSYDDADNFTKNLVTARVECQEDLNLLRTEAVSIVDMGNSSSS